MPHEVIMPALGMAQDTGLIVAWHKSPGDPVASDDVLFEVETDKATMEVAAGADGFVTQIRHHAGDEVPVGDVIALIGETTEAVHTDETPAGAAAPATEIPAGTNVIMPALGMTQDTGVIVNWHKAPGDAVAATDILFEVETDKATMEVEAGSDGFVAALLAEAGEEAPVGDTIAVISAEKPDNPVQLSLAGKAAPVSTPAPAAKPATEPAPKPEAKPAPTARPAKTKTPAAPAFTGKVLASPKARRLAAEQGLDLSRLAAEGFAMPYHVADLDTLRALPDPASAATSGAAAAHLTARVSADGSSMFTAFLDGAAPQEAVWAAFAGASLRAATGADTLVIRVDQPVFGRATCYADPDRALLSATTPTEEAAPDLILRDLSDSRVTGGTLGVAEAPALTIARDGDDFVLGLDFSLGQLDADAAISLIDGFAGRLEQPLRHLL